MPKPEALIRTDLEHGHRFVLSVMEDGVWARCEVCGDTRRMGIVNRSAPQEGEFPQSYQEEV